MWIPAAKSATSWSRFDQVSYSAVSGDEKIPGRYRRRRRFRLRLFFGSELLLTAADLDRLKGEIKLVAATNTKSGGTIRDVKKRKSPSTSEVTSAGLSGWYQTLIGWLTARSRHRLLGIYSDPTILFEST
jgi:hypothetical protein